MDFLYITHLLNGLLMILLPVGLGIFLSRKLKLGWRLFWIGAATFIFSQVGHIPFNYGLTYLFRAGILPSPPEAWQLAFNAVVLGLSAGLWEEGARYVTYRWWAKEARSWGEGLMLGAGHGGIEAIILGFLVLLTYINMVVARGMDLGNLVSGEQLTSAQAQIQAYWSIPWYASLLGALERVFALTFHLAASLLVLQAFIRRQAGWLWLAIGWHTLLDGATVYTAGIWGPYLVEVMLAGFALANLGIIFALRRPNEGVIEERLLNVTGEDASGEYPSLTGAPDATQDWPEDDESADKLEESRFVQ
jgi:uncharacterized membrane protein YhfC